MDILNPVSGDDFVLMLKELVLPNGQRRPYSVWLAGVYPRALDGLCKLLSLDMRVIDPAWIGMKLRKLTNYAEPLGDFMARVPGSNKQQNWPSTVAYIARLVMHRYAMLGILDDILGGLRRGPAGPVIRLAPRLRAGRAVALEDLAAHARQIHALVVAARPASARGAATAQGALIAGVNARRRPSRRWRRNAPAIHGRSATNAC